MSRYAEEEITHLSTVSLISMEEALKDSLRESFKSDRGKLEIMVEVRSIARRGVGKTEIVYKANLNFKRVSGIPASDTRQRGRIVSSYLKCTSIQRTDLRFLPQALIPFNTMAPNVWFVDSVSVRDKIKLDKTL